MLAILFRLPYVNKTHLGMFNDKHPILMTAYLQKNFIHMDRWKHFSDWMEIDIPLVGHLYIEQGPHGPFNTTGCP